MKTKIPMNPYKYLWSYNCGGSIISIDSTPDCSLITTASVDCKLRLLNKDGILLWEKSLDNEAWSVCISATGKRIAVGTASKKPADGTVYVYNHEGVECLRYGIGAPVWGVSLSEDGSILAVTSWNNKTYRFIENGKAIYRLEHEINIGTKGLYGVSLSRDGAYCAISSYEDAIVLLDRDWSIIKRFPTNTGLYGVKLLPDASIGIAGLRNGSYLLFENLLGDKYQTSPQISSRPICGVSLSEDFRVFALGSFDGRAYITSPKGHCLYTIETDGEVWSTAMSANGSIVCVGSGDQTIYLIENFCNSTVLKEMELLEDAIENGKYSNLNKILNDIASLYLSCGLINYGVLRLKDLAASEPLIKNNVIQEFLLTAISENPDHYEAHFLIANLFKNKGEWIPAIHHYQKATNNSFLRSNALNATGECFSKLGWKTAAVSCFHRAAEQYLNQDEKKVIYNLARSYEDSGYWREAAKHYQLILSWDIQYRNALERLRNIATIKHPAELIKRQTDYTGLTVSLLGPDIPRINEVDITLENILEARSRELFVIPGERAKMQNAINTSMRIDLTQSIKHKSLDYNTASYIKYDYLLPEDEIKKKLEMINFLVIIQDNQWIKSSLDIGTATGRYPFVLATMGINAIGIDKESDAIAYAKRKKIKNQRTGYPFFYVSDVTNLQFGPESFDLITCMMGTFAHFIPEVRKNVCQEMIRVLRPSGLIVISTWDIEYKHLSFLSMYSQSQKEIILRNSLTQAEIQVFLGGFGLEVIDIKPFAIMPDLFSSELQFVDLTEEDIRRIVEFDLAARGIFPNSHGQMFMLCVKKNK